MSAKNFGFEEMRTCDFNSTSKETSTDNCSDCDDFDRDICDMLPGKYLEKQAPKEIPANKYKNATSDELLKHVAVSLDKLTALIEFQNKILLEQTNNRGGF